MNYYISAKTGKKKKTGKVILYIIAYVLVFALSFFISFKLVAGTQSGSREEVAALKEELATLNSQLAEKEERITSLEIQIENIKRELSEAGQKAADALAAAENETDGTRTPGAPGTKPGVQTNH